MSTVCNGSQLDAENSNRNELARRRWKLLAQVLQKKRSEHSIKDVSVRRFTSFGLFQTQRLPDYNNKQDNGTWAEYTYTDVQGITVRIKQLSRNFTASELIGFNNTGNICIWPSEETLGYYCLHNQELFKDKAVIELGGGMTCLTGIMLAKCAIVREIHLTDGNKLSVDNVQQIINQNDFGSTLVTASILQWNVRQTYEHLHGKYDVALSADCLFFDEARKDLVETFWSVLNDNGLGLVMAPKRGDTFDKFVKEASKRFHCSVDHFYDDHVWNKHIEFKQGSCEYDEDLHYPILVQLKKHKNGCKNNC